MPGLPRFLGFLALALAGCAGERLTAPRANSEVRRADFSALRFSPQIAAFPNVIPVPDGFAPEGIDFGASSTFYVASLATGAVFRGDARTGTGGLVVPPQLGRSACGVRYDARRNRLWVAGSLTGQAYVYDATTGATLATYQLSDPATGPTVVNDVVVLRDAVYFTENSRPVIYRIPLGPGGELPPATAVQTIGLTGDFTFVPGGINGNGVVATPNDGLIVGNTWTGALYLVDTSTGDARQIDLGGASLPWADGLVLMGRTLYVVQGPFNQIGVVRLSADYTTGVVDEPLTNARLKFPSSIGASGSSLYAVNARFDVQPDPTVEYDVVRVSR